MLKAMGCRVTCVVNGQAAIDAMRHHAYDLVLMDCQMPQMDGFTATQYIRQHLKETGGRHLPIIALTAHAMAGDRERCLAAGMDDYVSKPFTETQLQTVMSRWLASHASATQAAPDFDKTLTDMPITSPTLSSDGEASAESPLDPVTLNSLRNLGERRGQDVLGTVVQMYLDQTPNLLAVLQDAVARGDANDVHHVAHSLKSNAGNVGALTLVTLCQALENQGASQLIHEMADALTAIEMEYTSVRNALHTLIQETAP